MNRTMYFLTIVAVVLCNLTNLGLAQPSLSNLIKVAPNNNSKCIEYYFYKNELYCSTTAFSKEPVDPHLIQSEKLNIQFDDRPWRLGWGKVTSNFNSLEYVPADENINQWNELITSQFFPDLQNKITPKKFADLFVQNLKDQGYKPIVSFLKDTKNQVIFEYRIEQPENQIQDELQMVTSNNKGLYVLHYVIKKFDMGQKNRDKWVQNLANSTIKTMNEFNH